MDNWLAMRRLSDDPSFVATTHRAAGTDSAKTPTNHATVPVSSLPTQEKPVVHADSQPAFKRLSFNTYQEALSAIATVDKVIYLAFFDYGAHDMGINFVLTSVLPHNIMSILFISSDPTLCEELQTMSVACFFYMENKHSDQPAAYGGREFNEKMNIRTFMILEALELGYNVIQTDVDMFFYKDPLSTILTECAPKLCDIAPLNDNGLRSMNAGFLFVRNTSFGIAVYREMKAMALNHTDKNDQQALNYVVRVLRRSGLKAVVLSEKKFISGGLFFKERKFHPDEMCAECLVAHNNWIIGIDSKEYRFKELHMWMVDNGGYYSNPDAKYLTYKNDRFFGNEESTWRRELAALCHALAIGEILNRTLILPRPHTVNKTTLLYYTNPSKFRILFGNRYRESTFLSHPLTSERIKSSTSKPVKLVSDQTEKRHNASVKIISEKSVLAQCGGRQEPVLHFESLYDANILCTDPTRLDLRDRCKLTFLKCKQARHKD